MTVRFRTVVLDVAPSTLGPLPGRVVVEHRCNFCWATVVTVELVAHAMTTARRR
jgi:hypothetical protein